MYVFVSEDYIMLDWHSCQICYPLEKKLFLFLLLLLLENGLSPLYQKTFEPQHDKTNKMTCAPSEDSDQPGHPPSLIRVFAVRMKKPWVPRYPVSAQ